MSLQHEFYLAPLRSERDADAAALANVRDRSFVRSRVAQHAERAEAHREVCAPVRADKARAFAASE